MAKRILVVEDNRNMAKVIKQVLRGIGVRQVTSPTPRCGASTDTCPRTGATTMTACPRGIAVFG